MRISGGVYKGLRISTPSGKHTRPTLERVREALFSSLGHTIYEARFLDLFAGSGSMGIEALSRGASYAVFVEHHRKTLGMLQQNLEKLRISPESYRLIGQDATRYLKRNPAKPFDVIYIDPPYIDTERLLPQLLGQLNKHWVTDTGWVILETRRVPVIPEPWSIFQNKNYGKSRVLFLTKKNLAP